VSEHDSDPDRAAILARRRRLVELSLVGLSTTACASTIGVGGEPDTFELDAPDYGGWTAREPAKVEPERGLAIDDRDPATVFERPGTPRPFETCDPKPCLSIVPLDRTTEMRERERKAELLELERRALERRQAASDEDR
jgi:hypothetical protein